MQTFSLAPKTNGHWYNNFRMPRIKVTYSGQEVYLSPVGILGSLATIAGGLTMEIAQTPLGQSAGVILAWAGLVTACGAIIVPIGNKTIDMLMIRANFKAQLAEMSRQLASLGNELATARRDRDRLQAIVENVQKTAESGRQENRDLTEKAVATITDKIDSTIQKATS